MYATIDPGNVSLEPGFFLDRSNINRAYLMSLGNEQLLQNHYFEAGLRSECGDDIGGIDNKPHTGWETPSCQVRGHFLGHWISAAARLYRTNGDLQIKAKIDSIVSELGACQERNGNGWVFSIPEKYLNWIAQGQRAAVPHYIVHKTLMGLVDSYKYASNTEALEIIANASEWFYSWSSDFSREKMDDILDIETGGMLEVWADLYGVTGDPHHRELITRYTRARLFDPLLENRDVLTNTHANTTIPEAHGAARAYEVTGDERWRNIVEAYWQCAVTSRGTFCTGGQTSGEVWTPPFEYAVRRGDKNQEHCTVYNMIRLADYLFRWSGDATYLDYIERNIYNGILAQQHPITGMISYFLPLEAGGRKKWGTPRDDFWCCHGTLVQAHASHNAYIFYQREKEVLVSQYIPSRLTTSIGDTRVTLEMKLDPQSIGVAEDNTSGAGSRHRPNEWAADIAVSCDSPVDFDLKLRAPSWVAEKPRLYINGSLQPDSIRSGLCSIARVWHNDRVRIELPKRLGTIAIPDEPGTVAFCDGPVVLAGVCDREYTLRGDAGDPDSILVPDNERKHARWLTGYRTIGQQVGIRFKPLFEIVDEAYTTYFPIEQQKV